MKKETIAYAKRDISKVVRMTEDEKLVSSLWSFINGYFSKKPQEEDPRNQVETTPSIKEEMTDMIQGLNDDVSLILYNALKLFNIRQRQTEPKKESTNQGNLGPEFWDSKVSEVNMYNVKDKLIENIERISEDYVSNLQYLHKIYCMTEAYLKSENCNE